MIKAMIQNDIVFILGAGASKPFGYPIGTELADIIIHNLEGARDRFINKSNEYRFKLFEKLGFSREEIDEFKKALSTSTYDTIDLFLKRRKEFMKIGKCAIADAIISCEDEKILSQRNNDNWYRRLFNMINAPSCSDFCKNPISFITFNYDRSLEQYLYQTLSNAYPTTKDEISSLLKTIPVIHVHGKLGDLPWQTDKNEQPYNNGRRNNEIYLGKSAEMISIPCEKIDIDSDSVFSECYKLLERAKKIFIFGFGYDRDNLDSIKIRNNLDGKSVIGTNIGIDLRRYKEIKDYFREKIFLGDIERGNVKEFSIIEVLNSSLLYR